MSWLANKNDRERKVSVWPRFLVHWTGQKFFEIRFKDR